MEETWNLIKPKMQDGVRRLFAGARDVPDYITSFVKDDKRGFFSVETVRRAQEFGRNWLRVSTTREKIAISRDRSEDEKQLQSVINKLAPGNLHSSVKKIREMDPDNATVLKVAYDSIVKGAQLGAMLILFIESGVDVAIFKSLLDTIVADCTKPLAAASVEDRDAFNNFMAEMRKRQYLARWLGALQILDVVDDVTPVLAALADFLKTGTDNDLLSAVAKTFKALCTSQNVKRARELLPKDAIAHLPGVIRFPLSDIYVRADRTAEIDILIARLYFSVYDRNADKACEFAGSLGNIYRELRTTERNEIITLSKMLMSSDQAAALGPRFRDNMNWLQ